MSILHHNKTYNIYKIPNGWRNCKCINWKFLFTGQGYGSIIPQPSDADPDPLKHEPTEKLVGKIVQNVKQYVESMEKVIEITG